MTYLHGRRQMVMWLQCHGCDVTVACRPARNGTFNSDNSVVGHTLRLLLNLASSLFYNFLKDIFSFFSLRENYFGSSLPFQHNTS